MNHQLVFDFRLKQAQRKQKVNNYYAKLNYNRLNHREAGVLVRTQDYLPLQAILRIDDDVSGLGVIRFFVLYAVFLLLHLLMYFIL